jgi:transposase
LATGRPSYHPSVLLKLYIYGYLNRVQSSRRLEREAGCNVEAMWLTGRLVPDHKTIADFRKDNGPAIRKVCSQFVALCRRLELFADASVAIDGSKFKAVNTRDRNFTRAKMKRRMEQIEESVERYLHQLDSADRQEPSLARTTETARLKDKIVTLTEEMGRLGKLEVRMLAEPDQQISLTDPDARSMATSGRGSGMVGYNVQAAVDTKHHLIVAHEVGLIPLSQVFLVWGWLPPHNPAAWPGSTPPFLNSSAGFRMRRVAHFFCLSDAGRRGSLAPNAAGHGPAC